MSCQRPAVRSVSPLTTVTLANGTPRPSAAIWASTVVEPWPMSMAPDSKTNDPSRRAPILTVEGFGSAVLPIPYQSAAMPTPRRRVPGLARAASASARSSVQLGRSASRHSASPALARSSWPVAVRSPARSAFRSRSSSGSIPRRSASSSRRGSVAAAACGTPKPRNAPATGPVVWIARVVASTAGTT